MMQIFLFLATNVTVLLIIGIIFSLLDFMGVLNGHGGIALFDLNTLLVLSAIIGVTGSVISLALSKWSAKKLMGVRVIDPPQNELTQWLIDTVAEQARYFGIRTPEVGIFQAPEANAFTTGMNKNSALIAVSTGLLQTLSKDEIEAVIGHEITHIANGDMVTMALMQGVLNTFVYFFASLSGHVIDRVILQNQHHHGLGYFIAQLLAQITLGFLASLLIMWFSRYREFKADAGGAHLAGRWKMISALRALQNGQKAKNLPGQLAAFGINGRSSNGVRKLFISHPTLKERIAALERISPMF